MWHKQERGHSFLFRHIWWHKTERWMWSRQKDSPTLYFTWRKKKKILLIKSWFSKHRGHIFFQKHYFYLHKMHASHVHSNTQTPSLYKRYKPHLWITVFLIWHSPLNYSNFLTRKYAFDKFYFYIILRQADYVLTTYNSAQWAQVDKYL